MALSPIPHGRPHRRTLRRVTSALAAAWTGNLGILGRHLFQERRKSLAAVLAQNFNRWFAHLFPPVFTLRFHALPGTAHR
jgi:hypothetical protein